MKRQCEYFHGRLAARSALAAAGIHGFDVDSDPQRAPVFPEPLIGSISHTGSLAVCAVLPGQRSNGLGIDVEQWIADEVLAAVTSVAFSGAEQQVMRSASLPFPLAATLAFSAKESFYKAVSRHAGRVLEYSVLRLLRFDQANKRMDFVVAEHVCREFPKLTALSIDYGLLDARTVSTTFLW